VTEIFWPAQASYPILAVLQLLPAVGALVVFLLGERPAAVAVGRLWVLATLVPAVGVYSHLNQSLASFQLAERLDAIAYHAAADGITALFVLVAALIVGLSVVYGLVRGLHAPGRLLAVILAAEAALMTSLVTVNLIWFALASAVEFWLVAYLLAHWSTSTEDNRALAQARFLQFQSFGWLLLVAGIIVVVWNHADARGGRWTFDLLELADLPPPGKFQTVAFYLMFYGLAIRTPLFPLHGWLPSVAHRGMVAIAPSLLLGVKVGLYGMIRYLLPLTPDAVTEWQHYVVAFAMVGVFFTATMAFLQTNLRRLLSFAVVSHTSLIVIGLFTLHPVGIQGAILLSANFGFAATVMLFMVGFVFRRTKTTDLDKLGGLFDRIPFIAVAFFIGGLSIVGMPGTPGFDSAHLVLEASIDSFGALPTVATALGNVAAAGFLLWAFQRAFLAPPPAGMVPVETTLAMEVVVGSVALALLLAAGFYPEPWMKLTDASTQAIGHLFGGGGH
jgi:NADH-quinone oxidoreductase subunit M